MDHFDVGYGYTRLSIADKANPGLSPTVQAEQISLYCKIKQIRLESVFTDLAVSGGIALSDRPQGAQLCRAIMAGNCTVIAVRQDRLFRDLEDAVSTMKIWIAAKIKPICIAEGLDLSTPAGRMMFSVMAAFGQYEREIIGERTKTILRAKRSRGERVCRDARFGFRFEASGRINGKGEPVLLEVPDQAEQDAIALMREMRRRGKSLRAIGAALDAREIRPRRGGKWQPGSVREILNSAQSRKHKKASAAGETTIDEVRRVDDPPADSSDGG